MKNMKNFLYLVAASIMLIITGCKANHDENVSFTLHRGVNISHWLSQSSARKILCITYTNAAVDEIAKRLDGYTDSVEVCTIHNMFPFSSPSDPFGS